MRPAAAAVHVVVAAALLILPGCRTPSASGTTASLDALFADLHGRRLFDGAVSVSARGHVFAKAFGLANAAAKVPFTPHTPADGGSLAKTFTAALLIVLEGEKLLQLDTPAQRLLPELPYPGITLRHLISHSAAIPVHDYDYFDPYIPRDQVRTTESLLAVIAARRPPLAAEPGTTFEYSSFGFDLAALAAERAAGKPYAQLLDERFFRPLGMSSTFLRPARLADFPGPRTVGYRRVGETLAMNDVFDLEGFYGGSNIYFSAADLERWNVAFLRTPALGQKELDRALEPAKIGSGTSGLTLGSWYSSDDRTAFWYSGHLQGFHSEVFRRVDTHLSIVYVSNNTLDPWLQKAIVRAATAAMEGRTPLPLQPPATERVGATEHVRLAGRWAMQTGHDIVIESSGGTLSVLHDGVRYRIVQVSPSAFYVPGLDWVLGFARGADSALSRIVVSTNVNERRGVRAVR